MNLFTIKIPYKRIPEDVKTSTHNILFDHFPTKTEVIQTLEDTIQGTTSGMTKIRYSSIKEVVSLCNDWPKMDISIKAKIIRPVIINDITFPIEFEVNDKF